MKTGNNSWTQWHRVAATALLVCAPVLTYGEQSFVPTDLGNSAARTGQFKTLSNDALDERADQMRNNSLSAHQRAMNFQWLSEHSGQESAIHGKRAVSRLIQRSFKSYWNRKRDEHFGENTLVPDSDGRGNIRGFDYDLHVSDDELEVGIVYEF